MSSDPLHPTRPKLAVTTATVLWLAVVALVTLGPQLALWTCGPALLLLAVAGVLALPLAQRLPGAVLATGLPLVAWLAYRAAGSSVTEFAVTDMALLAIGVAAFFVTRAVLPQRAGLEVLFTGLGVLALANWFPLVQQARDPGHLLWLPRGSEAYPSGFFGYYGDGAAFLLAVALLAGGLVWDGRRASWFRVFMAVVALAAAAGVVFTRTRGGMLGLGAGGLLLLVLAPWLALPRGSRWQGVAALLLPLVVVAGILWLGKGLSEAQEARGLGDHGSLSENAARLFWWQMAISCISGHPWIGGGSRSFSWESLRSWDADWEKFSGTKPEFAHNELLQLTTDYGLVGLVLLLLFLGAVVVTGIVARWNGSESRAATPVFIGGCAALVGLLVHAQFHFVFHIPPLAAMFGISLACILATVNTGKSVTPAWARTGRALIPVACSAVLAWFGIRSMQVFRELWPVTYRFGQPVPDLSEALSRIDRATRAWPSAELLSLKGRLAMRAAETAGGAEKPLLHDEAAAAFGEALILHPFSAEASVNRANVLSRMGRDEDAEVEYNRAIEIQGGLERGVRARLFAADHFSRKAERLRAAGKVDEALATLIRARDVLDQGSSETFWEYGEEGRAFRLALIQNLGPWLEGIGRHEEAAAEYDRALKIAGGNPIHFLAARNLTSWGDAQWLQRQPEQALAKFLAARDRLMAAAGQAPTGYRVEDITALVERVNGKIALLEEARVKPAR